MKTWVVIYKHRYGIDAFPLFQQERPSEEEAKEGTGCFKEGRDEDVEVMGPWKTPSPVVEPDDFDQAIQLLHLVHDNALEDRDYAEIKALLIDHEIIVD